MRARHLDRGSWIGMALGMALVLQPWWPAGLRAGFFVTAASIVAQIIAAHLPQEPRA